MRSAMYYFFILVMLFNCGVICEGSVIFDFENGLEDFNNEVEACAGLDMWNLGSYSNLSMDGFHQNSSAFVNPLSSMSCMASPIFQIGAGGTLESYLYLKPNVSHVSNVTKQGYQIKIAILKSEENNNDPVVSIVTNPLLKEGWQSINITVLGSDFFWGYVVLMGIADHQQLILLDSLRYFANPENEDTSTTTETPTTETLTTETPTIETHTTETRTTETPTTETPTTKTPTTKTPTTETPTTKTPTTETPTTETESFKTSTESETTDDPSQEDKTSCPFWNAFSISMVTILSLIVIFVIAFISYKIVKGRT